MAGRHRSLQVLGLCSTLDSIGASGCPPCRTLAAGLEGRGDAEPGAAERVVGGVSRRTETRRSVCREGSSLVTRARVLNVDGDTQMDACASCDVRGMLKNLVGRTRSVDLSPVADDSSADFAMGATVFNGAGFAFVLDVADGEFRVFGAITTSVSVVSITADTLGSHETYEVRANSETHYEVRSITHRRGNEYEFGQEPIHRPLGRLQLPEPGTIGFARRTRHAIPRGPERVSANMPLCAGCSLTSISQSSAESGSVLTEVAVGKS